MSTTLGACAHFLSGGTPRKSIDEYWRGSIPWFSAKDLKSFYLTDSEDHITPEGAEAGSRLVPPGTILLLVRGMTLHNDTPIGVVTRKSAFNQDIKAIRANEGVQQSFLAHWLISQKQRLLSTVHAAGHGTGVLATDRLQAIELDLPSPAEQAAIANVFDLIEDKIEQNRRTAAKLEGLARATFRAWFVDFAPVRAKAAGATTYPGLPPTAFAALPTTFTDSPLGPIPKGWAAKVLDETCTINPPLPLKKGQVAPYLDMKSMPTQGHRPNEVYDREFGSGMRFQNGDTLVARITPCLENGKTAFVDFLKGDAVGWGSTEYIVIRPKPPLPPIYGYCVARTPEFRDFAIQNMSGTSGRQRVSLTAMSHFNVAVPTEPIASTFGETVRPLFDLIKAGDEESRHLAALRDYLLPRLLSGAVGVRNASTKGGEK